MMNPSFDRFVEKKEDLEKIKQTTEEFAGFKRQQEAVVKADSSAVPPPSPATAKTLFEAQPGSSCGSASKLRVVLLIPPDKQKPSSATSPSLKRPSPIPCVPTPPSMKMRPQFVFRFVKQKQSSAAEPSLNPMLMAASRRNLFPEALVSLIGRDKTVVCHTPCTSGGLCFFSGAQSIGSTHRPLRKFCFAQM